MNDRDRNPDAFRRAVRGLLLPCLVAAALCGGCNRTIQTRDEVRTGFLDDYAQLRRGEGDEARLVYVAEDVDFSRYRGVIVDPVQVRVAPGWFGRRIPPRDARSLAAYLHGTIRAALEPDYQIVGVPDARVMRLRVAISEARRSVVLLDAASTFVPQLRSGSTALLILTGTHAFVGKAGIEMELVDSTTGKRLMAVVDERAGRKAVVGVLSGWDDVKQAYDFWAEDLARRLKNRGRGVVD